MSKIKGKKLTVNQIKAIQRYYHDKNMDCGDWLYQGEKSVDDNGYKCTSKNSPKQKYFVFINRNSGEVIEVEI